MKTKEIFINEMEAKVARAQAEIERYTALGMGFTAAAKKRHDEQVEALEQKIDDTRARLRTVGEAKGHVWEELRDQTMSSWEILKSALQDSSDRFIAEPPVAGLHGNDDGDYPYGNGLSGRPSQKTKLKKEQDHGR